MAFARISDPFHPQWTAIDFSIPLFILVYGSLLLGVMHVMTKPNLALEFLQTMTFVYLFRIFSLYIAPLETPQDAIFLNDPFSKPLERDLFFSGHTATTSLMLFTTRTSHLRWKFFFFVTTVLTALMVIIQKTHYVLDVSIAPFIGYGFHRLIFNLRSHCDVAYTCCTFDVVFVIVRMLHI